jgi:mono/diheme cytochrome c family protein
VLVSLGVIAAPAEPDAAGLEFFEKNIRPIFVENCYKCHSAQSDKIKGGLLLDSREGLLKGGETGPAIVPGEPEKSLFIKAVRYTDEKLQMPPKDKKLSSAQIADLEAWVKMGAPDPRTGPASTVRATSAAKQHWAYQPIKSPSIPVVRNFSRVQTPVDAFILAQLEAKGISVSDAADRRTLIRRATFDLTGLPPTAEEVAEFLADESSDAFTKVVERLLASPRYGERWGRYWLDVARYSDTKGYVFEEERRFAYSYTYRDYVIRAFNEDLPYDRFLTEQIAADLLPLGEDKRSLAALGFLTLGRRFLNNQADIIDDRIDVVTRGTMGLTVACARCHDHKYDPIPTKDYYSLYGVFASSSEPAEKPLLGANLQPPGYAEYLAERKKRQEELTNFRETKEAEAVSQLRQRSGEYLLAAYDASKLTDGSRSEWLARERKLHPGTVQRWRSSLESWSKETNHPIFAPWSAFAKLPEKEFAAKAGELTLDLAIGRDATNSLNPLVALAFAGEPPASMKEVAERYGKLFADVDKRWQDTLKANQKIASASDQAKRAAVTAFADVKLEAVRQVLYSSGSPVDVSKSEIVRLFDVPTAQKSRALQRKVEELDATHPGAPPRAMALQDNSSPYNPRVFVRGNANNFGPEVPRQFVEIIAGEKRQPFKKGSGRLELAQAIVSRDNPLTARVIVNRVWLHYFGVGLVRTPSDFGVRCDPPSHPELLDYLAGRFMDEGWSLKNLHRVILLSSVYQQSSDDNPRFAQVDPSNALLWKMNRRRLDFEAMRDSLLAVAGKLDLTVGGRAVELTTEPFSTRRTVYGFIERQNLPSLFRTFDFASPDTTSSQRFLTTVPQQALFMINSPFVVQQARQFVDQPELKSGQSDETRIRRLYQTVYQREPASDEIESGLRFIKSQQTASLAVSESPAWQYGYGEYDEITKRVNAFRPLPHFTGQAWQGGAKIPDEKLGWVMLTAAGGHPGNDRQHAAIRRWTASMDGAIAISGTLSHTVDKGDGVQGRIISSRAGELGAWIAQNGKSETKLERIEVKKGETIDFVAECRQSVDNDSFSWSPEVRTMNAGSQRGAAAVWNSQQDFGGPKETLKSLNPWERYAQVLLMSNELVFLD